MSADTVLAVRLTLIQAGIVGFSISRAAHQARHSSIKCSDSVFELFVRNAYPAP